MSSNQHFLQNLYDAFNKRETETIISLMRPDVKWANGLEGGFVYGRDAVREYWTNQFKDIQPELETLKFETDENNRNIVTVHQIIKDLQGNVLADATVHQIFTIEDGLISLYEIGETDTIHEMIEKISDLKKQFEDFSIAAIEQAEIQVKYEVYLKKEEEMVMKMSALEDQIIPDNLNYEKISSLSNEARQKFNKIKPQTLGQASRISGVNPSDVQILMVYMGR